MTELSETAGMALSAPTTTLALILAILAVGICGFALFLVYRVLHGRPE